MNETSAIERNERLKKTQIPCPDKKIDTEELIRLYRDGWTHKELAAHFGCQRTTVTEFIKRLKKRGVSLSIAGQQDQIFNTLNRIRDAIQREFKWLEKSAKQADAEQRRETLSFLLDTSAEIRAQEKLVVDIAKTIYEIRTKEEFQKVIGVILDAITAESCPECLERISNRIREAGNLERGVQEITEARISAP